MKYLLIPVLWFLSTGKLTFQCIFSKTRKCTYSDSIFFNAVMFSAVAAIFFPFLLANGAHAFTLICGMIMGLFSLLFQISYILAFSKGKASLTVTVNNFSLLIPVVASYLLFDESFGAFKLVGTVLILLCFIMTVSKDKEKKPSNAQWLPWLGFTMLVFLSNGVLSVNQKVYSKMTEELEVFEFVGAAYLFAALLSWGIFFLIRTKREGAEENASYKKAALLAGLSGVFLGAFQCVNTYAASLIDGSVLFPVTNCGISLILTLIGRLFFGEKLSGKQYAGVLIGVVAITLICI